MARINPDSFYVNGVTLPAAWWQAIDTAQSQTVNGDIGSTHTPSSALAIGGSGIWLCGPSTFAGSGGGFGVLTQFASGKRIVHGDNDWIQYQFGAGNSDRTLVESMARGWGASFVPAVPNGVASSWGPELFQAADALENQGSPLAATVPYPGYAGGGRLIAPLRVHHAATLVSVTFVWVVQLSRAALPQSQPRFRAISVDALGNVLPLNTNSSIAGWLPGGWVQTQFASAAAYFNSGGVHSLVYAVDPGTIVDITSKAYFVQVIDESGDNATTNAAPAKALNKFFSATATITNMPDMQPG